MNEEFVAFETYFIKEIKKFINSSSQSDWEATVKAYWAHAYYNMHNKNYGAMRTYVRLAKAAERALATKSTEETSKYYVAFGKKVSDSDAAKAKAAVLNKIKENNAWFNKYRKH